MKREDTYTIYRSEARGEAARDARNTSEGKKSFIRMKQKFLPKETAVPSEGNFAHSARPYPVACKLLTFVFALLFIGANWNEAWGQTKIIAAGNRDTVHTKTEIIYVDSNTPRVLSIPELKINDGHGDATYKWYVHWYHARGEIKGIDIYLDSNEATARGGSIHGGWYATDLRDATDGLWWYDGFYGTGKNDKNQWAHLSSCASTIQYTAPADLGSEEDVLYCDVSNYTDYDKSRLTGDEGTFTEPTLLKRYKYIIRPASECADVLKEGRPLETYEIDYPAGSENINFSMRSLPQNYFWYKGAGKLISGNKFKYSIGDAGYVDFTQYRYQVEQIDLSTYTSSVVVNVIAVSENGETSPILAKYTFNPVKETGFKLEEDVDESRKPELWEDLYEEIGIVDFDQDDVISALTNPEDNLADKPMNSSETVYGFVFKDLPCLREFLTSSQNQYGLYRSANLPGISQSGISGGGQYQYPYIFTSDDGKDEYTKYYKWIPPYMNATEVNETTQKEENVYLNTVLYDRTFARDGKYGFFYYIDASDDPGTLVDVPIKGTLCGQTELVVTAWVADMTRPKPTDNGATPLPPNINLILKGKNSDTDEEKVFHFFTSGDALTAYNKNKINHNLMKWQQLCYRIVLPAEIDQYRDFHLEVQNNEPHTDGADYAIDDVRVYKTLPNIKVQREDACDASSLTISVDYQTMLMNMGWQAGEAIVDENTVLYSDELDLVKYRFGLNGPNAVDPTKVSEESHVGNTYFSFVEGFDENTTENVIDITDRDLKNDEEPDPIILDKGHVYRWVRVNKSLTLPVPQSMYSFRIINSTIMGDKNYPSSQEEALKREKILNFRAVNDYNTAVKLYNEASDKSTVYKPSPNPETDKIEEIPIDTELTEDNIYWEKYEEEYRALVETLYMRLQIPRIRCPWIEGDEPDKIYLYTLDVNNTDLKYVGEQVGVDSDGKAIKASGEYHVVLQGAQAVEGWQVPGGDASATTSFNLKDPCVLKSPFKVQPAVRVTVETMNNTSGLVCLGTQRKIGAELVGRDGSTLATNQYGFDWYLGSMEDYNKISFGGYSLKDAIAKFRETHGDQKDFSETDVKAWGPTEENQKAIRNGLLELFGKGLLRINDTEFTMYMTNEEIVAMPYIDSFVNNGEKLYCTDVTSVLFDLNENDVPEIYPGIVGVEYPDDLTNVPIRLGLRHIESGKSLTIPIRKNIKYAVEENEGMKNHSLILNKNNTSVYLMENADEDISQNPTKVGNVTAFFAKDQAENNSLTIKFEHTYTFEEGKEYTLYIPFSESGDGETILGNACDGWARLQIKVVPEYLTWSGKGSAWYNDEGAWTMSTSEELYGKVTNTVSTSSFSPLYFTKITIPGFDEDAAANELGLVDESSYEKKTLDFQTMGITSGTTTHIEYDMAVGSDDGKDIRPYYGNWVEQIYFKPEASIYRQDYLTYGKAWVDFEMEEGKPYWMSAPLQNVYAGDMYAPSSNGRQETEAFTDITYSGKNENGTTNSRWSPAFYQKAWDKAIAYVTEGNAHNANNAADVAAVKSNWSIEYNDVWVPYSKGKGFYARVEDLPDNSTSALVRLPKADTKYSYEASTRAAGNLSDGDDISRTNANRLWGNTEIATKGNVTVDLSTVDGDNEHFLIGNPYMGYLDMNAFFNGNPVLAKKYWILENGTSNAVVGTPDVDWIGNETENGMNGGAITGLIPPMTAFFVELATSETSTQAEGETTTDKEITFTPTMMATRPSSTTNEGTRSYSATNPTLTITAERGETKSVAKLVTSDKADNGYEASEDAVLLLDSELDAPMVYTVAGDVAAQFNTLRSIKNVPLGIYNKKGDEVTLTISGLSRLVEPLYLYDAWTGKSKELTGDSYQLTVEGESLGRYYLRNEALASELESTISIYSLQPGEIVAASSGAALRQVRVYGVNGELVTQRSAVGQTACRLSVPRGAIYMIYAEDTKGNSQSVKLRVR